MLEVPRGSQMIPVDEYGRYRDGGSVAWPKKWHRCSRPKRPMLRPIGKLPCVCGHRVARYDWDDGVDDFRPPVCAECGRQIPVEET
jgi:hypothetical protein